MRKILLLICLPALFLVTACKKSYDVGTTKTPKTSNGWWVTYYAGGVAQSDPVFLSTYSTAANTTDSLWVDDLKHFWQFKGKFKLNYSNLTFGSNGSENAYYTSLANIANGKILLKSGHSRAGNVTDSIYFEIKFSDEDDGTPAHNPTPYATTFVVTGTARTGLIEDDY